MEYKRAHLRNNQIIDLIKDIDKYASDYRVVNIFYDKSLDSYIAVLEREVKE